MLQEVGKLWVPLLLAFTLAMSVFAAPMSFQEESYSGGAVTTPAEHEPVSGHNHSHPAPCHKAASCETSAAVQLKHKISIADIAEILVFFDSEPTVKSAAPEALLPPPKA